MTTIKIIKKDMVEAITEHLSAQGRRMTNLKKASEEQLQSLVERYEIDIQEFAKNRKEEMKRQRAIDKKAKEKRVEVHFFVWIPYNNCITFPKITNFHNI